MSVPEIDLAHAAVQCIDQGESQQLNLEQATAAITHLANHSKSELIGAMAYLACQVIGYRQRSNQDAVLAMAQIERAVTEYRRRAA